MLKNKKILVGICGSIAAYKSAFLIRLLIKSGAEVKVIMTEAAKDFITPLTISTLSKNAVYSEFYNKSSGEWANHVELGLWADIFVIAPATANEIAKMANGLCDNLLTATYLSARCPVFFCPAMDVDMYLHQSVKKNIETLISYQNILIRPENGELASGLHGVGRMAEPEHIIETLENYYSNSDQSFSGKKILITAGPTQEALDPVRFISNHSSGKMGIALANALTEKGAEVIFISGVIAHGLISQIITKNITKTTSAKDMYEACKKQFSEIDVAIFTAAVADYRPAEVAIEKIKKSDDNFVISLVKNTDIAAEFGKIKSNKQLSVGFALETNQEQIHAKSKLEKKNFDMIVLNSMQDAQATFGYDTNKISILKKNSDFINFSLKSKNEVAQDIIAEIKSLL